MTELQISKKPSFEVSTESATLIHMISSGSIGDKFTHDELSAAIASDHRPYMSTVRARLVEDHAISIGSIHKEGYVILSAVEILDRGDDIRNRIRRANKKRVKELRVIEPSNLPDDTQKGRYFQEVAHTAMMHAIHEQGTQKRIAEASAAIKPTPGVALTLQQISAMFTPATKA